MLATLKFLLTGIILFISTIITAGPFPHGCEVKGFGFNNHFLVLNEHGEQSFYLIQNHSGQEVELELYETREVFMSPKLHSRLGPQKWSAFASDIANQYVKCFTQQEEKIIPVNCDEILEVCLYPRVKFALSNMGSYWVSTNKDQIQVIRDAAAKGIYLRW